MLNAIGEGRNLQLRAVTSRCCGYSDQEPSGPAAFTQVLLDNLQLPLLVFKKNLNGGVGAVSDVSSGESASGHVGRSAEEHRFRAPTNFHFRYKPGESGGSLREGLEQVMPITLAQAAGEATERVLAVSDQPATAPRHLHATRETSLGR
jgi:hypothetical protein